MTMSVPVAIVATLIAAFMFALWYQFLNHLKQFPLPGFVFWLYISAYITVWVAVLFLGRRDLPNGIMAELEGKYGLALLCVFGGICMTSGLIISLIHMKANGMVANQAIAGSIGSILGLIVTFVVGGLAPGIPLSGVLIASAVIILASIVIQQSSIYKYRERGIDLTSRDIDRDKSMPDSIMKQNLMLVLSNVLSIGYSIAFMLGTRSVNHPNGFPPLLVVLLLCTGSLLAAVTYALISLGRSGQLKVLFKPEFKFPIALGLIAGFCHYGGTILQIYALPPLSAPVSSLLIRTSSVWTFFWGILYGEYKGASKKVIQWLAAGIALYLIGTVYLTYIINPA